MAEKAAKVAKSERTAKKPADPEKDLLTESEAALMLDLHPQTLARWAATTCRTSRSADRSAIAVRTSRRGSRAAR